MKKYKMAFIDNTDFISWPMGGMLTYERTILPELSKYFDIDLWGCTVDGSGKDNITIIGQQYEMICFGNSKTRRKIFPNYFRPLFEIKFKKEVFEEKKYDVIYAHTATCLIPIAKMQLSKKPLFVFHQHGLSYIDAKALMSKMMYWPNTVAQQLADMVYVVTSDEKLNQYVEKNNLNSEKYKQINSPLNLEAFDNHLIKNKVNSKRKAKKFITTGRLIQHKNQRILIPTFKKYLDEVDKDATLYIVGDGEDYAYIGNLILKYKLDNQIIMTGRLSLEKTIDLLQQTDVFVFPSKGEGMPLSILEAYACALPIVSFDVEGVSNMVKNGETGYKATEMTEQSFYHALIMCVDNVAKMRESVYKEKDKYNVQIMVKKMYEDIVRRQNKRDLDNEYN